MTIHHILAAYTRALAFTTVIFAVCYWAPGDSGSVIFRRVLLAPLFLLAILGLRSHFPRFNDNTRSVGTQIAFQLLTALAMSVFRVSIGPSEDASVNKSLVIFLAFARFMTIWNVAFFVFDRRSR
ncbi:hypothetical protein AB4Z52_12415 [Rhizobium sp. 2YAF20]|uniref:hypothetical protein n=1 Tax=Rhizobium sp. 2YAF20 TaxID=3233027 RepID=UPI003F9C1DC7